ncbi:MAG: hypothetical protein GWP91_18675 [Rhodobacterales bacterium]|nr:hypothetical protein [Rhodobacterales bacterium]
MHVHPNRGSLDSGVGRLAVDSRLPEVGGRDTSPDMAHTYTATTELSVSPAVVWKALIDTDSWGDWSSFVPVKPGALEPGQSFSMAFSIHGRSMVGKAKLLRVQPERELTWRGGVPGLLQVTHGFVLEAVPSGCRLVHTESFEGLLSGLVIWYVGEQQAPKYEQVNLALKAQLEAR